MANEELNAIQASVVEPTTEQTEDKELAEIDAMLAALPDGPSEEDLLAAFFERHKAAVIHGLKKVSLRGLKRVMLNVSLGEFAPRGYDPSNDEERKLAFHFNECVTKRGVLRINEEFKRIEQAYKKEQEDLNKINEMTMNELSDDAKKLLAESGNTVKIENETTLKLEENNG